MIVINAAETKSGIVNIEKGIHLLCYFVCSGGNNSWIENGAVIPP